MTEEEENNMIENFVLKVCQKFYPVGTKCISPINGKTFEVFKSVRFDNIKGVVMSEQEHLFAIIVFAKCGSEFTLYRHRTRQYAAILKPEQTYSILKKYMTDYEQE